MAYKIGDKIKVEHLGDEWVDATVSAIGQLSKEDAVKIKIEYPDAQEGDQILTCSDSSGDTRNFLADHDNVKPA